MPNVRFRRVTALKLPRLHNHVFRLAAVSDEQDKSDTENREQQQAAEQLLSLRIRSRRLVPGDTPGNSSRDLLLVVHVRSPISSVNPRSKTTGPAFNRQSPE